MLTLACANKLGAEAPFALKMDSPTTDAGWRRVWRADFAGAIAKMRGRPKGLRMPALSDADLAAFGIKVEQQQWLKLPRSAARMMQNVRAATRNDADDQALIKQRLNFSQL
jgi:hypothetical protein